MNELEPMAGFSWADVFSALPASATAQALALAISPIAGSKPDVVVGQGYAEVTFTPEQEERIAAWLLMQLNREPGPVRMKLGGIALRVVVRKYWTYALGLVGVGAAGGWMAKGRKGRR